MCGNFGWSREASRESPLQSSTPTAATTRMPFETTTATVVGIAPSPFVAALTSGGTAEYATSDSTAHDR